MLTIDCRSTIRVAVPCRRPSCLIGHVISRTRRRITVSVHVFGKHARFPFFYCMCNQMGHGLRHCVPWLSLISTYVSSAMSFQSGSSRGGHRYSGLDAVLGPFPKKPAARVTASTPTTPKCNAQANAISTITGAQKVSQSSQSNNIIIIEFHRYDFTFDIL